MMPLLLLILASIHTMMQDMIRDRKMGIMMVSKIYEAILTMMLADIRERKGRNMSWGTKKNMMPVSMMALLIVAVIQRRKSSLYCLNRFKLLACSFEIHVYASVSKSVESCWHHCQQDSTLSLLFLICRLQIELYRTLL